MDIIWTCVGCALFVGLLPHGAWAARPVVDAALPVLDTGVRLIDRVPGEFFWLDDQTLAATTYGDGQADPAWTLRKIVAYDVPSRSTSTLVDSGFLACVDSDERLVSLHRGDLPSGKVGGEKAPPPAPLFFHWSRKNKTLANADAKYKAEWNRFGCTKTLAEDLHGTDWIAGREPRRYLRAQDGLLVWQPAFVEGSLPVSLSKKGKLTPLQLGHKELAPMTPWLPFAEAYLLSEGVFASGSGSALNQPMLLMRPRGEIVRSVIPAELRQLASGRNDSSEGEMFAVAGGGQLVSVAGRSTAARGLYLVNGDNLKRFWCLPPAGKNNDADESCRVRQKIIISPDGCRIAFGAGAQKAVQTIKVIELCTAGGKLL